MNEVRRIAAVAVSAIRRVAEDATGATAIEYTLIAAGISIVIVAAVALVGGSLTDFFTSLATLLSGG